MKPLLDRLYDKRRVDPVTGCWNWTASLGGNGYGQIYVYALRRPKPAHQISWDLHNPDKPRGRLFVLHRCDNKLCVNPDHLFLGTNQDNMIDARDKGRLRGFSVQAMCRRGLHVFSEDNVYVHTHKNGRVQRTCKPCHERNTAVRRGKLHR